MTTETDKCVAFVLLSLIGFLIGYGMDNDITSKIIIALIGALMALGFKHFYDIWRENQRLNYLKNTISNIIEEIIIPKLASKEFETQRISLVSEENLISNHHYFVDTRILKTSLLSIFSEYDLVKIFNKVSKKDVKLKFTRLYQLVFDLEIVTANSAEILLSQYIVNYYKIISGEIQSFDIQRLKSDNPDLNVNLIFNNSTDSMSIQNYNLFVQQIKLQLKQINELGILFVDFNNDLKKVEIKRLPF